MILGYSPMAQVLLCFAVSLLLTGTHAQPASHSRPSIRSDPRSDIRIHYPVDHWPNCTVVNEVHGTCKKIVHCSEAVEVILRGYHPTICYWERYKTFPLVCCPTVGDGTLDDVLPGKPNPEFEFPHHNIPNALTCGMTVPEPTHAVVEEEDESQEEGGYFVPVFRPHKKPDTASFPGRNYRNRKSKREIETWPWMVSIFADGSGESLVCSGFLIDDRHVLTAAKKLNGRTKNPTFSVRLGGNRESLYQVSKVSIHEDYKSWSQYNDIAVLELRDPITDAMPLCLPPTSFDASKIVGYNATILGGVSIHEDVPVVSHSWCQEMYSKFSPLTYPRGITDQFICAGLQLKDVPMNGVGDLGGPVMIQSDGKWLGIGLVSLDYKCANQGFPGVYINLAKYTDWIQRVISQ